MQLYRICSTAVLLFSVREKKEDVKTAEKYFGTAYNVNEARYLLTDGKLLKIESMGPMRKLLERERSYVDDLLTGVVATKKEHFQADFERRHHHRRRSGYRRRYGHSGRHHRSGGNHLRGGPDHRQILPPADQRFLPMLGQRVPDQVDRAGGVRRAKAANGDAQKSYAAIRQTNMPEISDMPHYAAPVGLWGMPAM